MKFPLENQDAIGEWREKRAYLIGWALLIGLIYIGSLGQLSALGKFSPWIETLSKQSSHDIPYLSICLFKNLTHLPCALCGLTRGLTLILQGHWQEASQYHLLAVPMFVLSLGLILGAFLKPTLTLRFLAKITCRSGLLFTSSIFGFCWLWKLNQPRQFW